MENKVNWSKIKIPSFGMSDAMVKYKNGTLPDVQSDDLFEKSKALKPQRAGRKKG